MVTLPRGQMANAALRPIGGRAHHVREGLMATAPASAYSPERGMTSEERKVIFASSLGTIFEWYDFYIYGTLAAILAKEFFSGVAPTAAFIFTLLAFAAGFAV